MWWYDRNKLLSNKHASTVGLLNISLETAGIGKINFSQNICPANICLIYKILFNQDMFY